MANQNQTVGLVTWK